MLRYGNNDDKKPQKEQKEETQNNEINKIDENVDTCCQMDFLTEEEGGRVEGRVEEEVVRGKCIRIGFGSRRKDPAGSNPTAILNGEKNLGGGRRIGTGRDACWNLSGSPGSRGKES